jgi:hypothetical protein
MAYNIYTNLFYEQGSTNKPVSEPKKTTNKKLIKCWAEARNGIPALAKDPETNNSSSLSIHFPNSNTNYQQLHPISWDTFFAEFEKHKLALVYKHKQDNGEKSTFYKLVHRN